MRYQKWNLVQDACSYLRGVMSTQAILTGMGVGRTDITTLEATVQWILRDGASMVGGLLFTTLSSANFGQNVKSWRIFADFINNLGITLDMIAPMFGKSFVTIVCVASVCKALCGVAAGATNAVIAEHWGAKNGNMADVLAKNGAQHTLVNLLGLSISVQFARFANVSSTRMWFVYTILTILHMYANIQAMRILALRSLNVARYDILVDTFINSDVFGNVIDHAVNSTSINSNDKIIVSDVLKSDLQSWMSTKNLLTPESVAKREPIISLIVPKPISILARKFYDFRIMVTSFQLKRLLEKRNKNNDDIQNCSPILSDKIYELQQILYTLLRMKPFKGQEVSKFGDVSIWVPPSTIVSKFSSQEISSSLSKYHNLDYFMIPSDDIGTKKHSTISVCCKSGCSNRQQAQAVFEAKVYLKCNDLTTASVLTSMIFPLFWEYLVNNWEVNRILLQPRFPRAYTAILNK